MTENIIKIPVTIYSKGGYTEGYIYKNTETGELIKFEEKQKATQENNKQREESCTMN